MIIRVIFGTLTGLTLGTSLGLFIAAGMDLDGIKFEITTILIAIAVEIFFIFMYI